MSNVLEVEAAWLQFITQNHSNILESIRVSQEISSDVENDLNKLAETDYCWVYFYLPMQEICNYGDIYIIGDLSHWKLQRKW